MDVDHTGHFADRQGPSELSLRFKKNSGTLSGSKEFSPKGNIGINTTEQTVHNMNTNPNVNSLVVSFEKPDEML